MPAAKEKKTPPHSEALLGRELVGGKGDGVKGVVVNVDVVDERGLKKAEKSKWQWRIKPH